MSQLIKDLYAQLEQADKVEDRIDLLSRLAFELLNQNNERFEEHNREALRLSEIAGYTKGTVDAYLNMGRVAFRKADYPACIQYSEKALQLAREADNGYLCAVALDNLSQAYMMIDKPKKALETALEAAELFARHKDPNRGRAMSLNNAGNATNFMGEHEKAMAYYTEAKALLEGTEFYSQQLSIEGNIAACLMHLKRYQEAYDKLGGLYDKFGAINHLSGQVMALDFMAQCKHGLEEYSAAINEYTRALKLLNRYDNKSAKVNILLGLGGLFLKIGGVADGLKRIKSALELSKSINFNKGATLAHLALAEHYKASGEEALARQHSNAGLALAREFDYKEELKALELLIGTTETT